MMYFWMGLLVAGIVGADQLSKWWVVQHIAVSNPKADNLAALGMTAEQSGALPEKIDGIPGIFSLSHFHNEGAAWSSFEGMIWLFALIFALFAAFIIWEFTTKKMGFTTFERWCIVTVFAGGLGNMIDRLRLGFVVDMINLDFMNFPVFNIADCFITCGCIALMVHLVFFNKTFWKDGKS